MISRLRTAWRRVRRADGKLNASLRRGEERRRAGRQFSVPVYLQIENTNRCNLACAFCSRNFWDRALNPPGDMSRRTFDKIRPLLRSAPIVAIQGLGEPLVGDSIWWMAEAVKEYGCHLIVNTNGTLLTEERAQRLIRIGVDKIFISVDAARDETFLKLRGIPVMPLLDKIAGLVALRERLGSRTPVVVLVFVAMKSNIHELPELIHKAAAAGIRDLEIRQLKIYARELSEESLLAEPSAMLRSFREAAALGAEFGMTVTLPQTDRSQMRCTQPFDMLFFRHDGEVYGCCSAAFKGSPYNRPLGLLDKTSVMELWNNPNMRALRRGLRGSGPLLEQCIRCAFRVSTCESHQRVIDAGDQNGQCRSERSESAGCDRT